MITPDKLAKRLFAELAAQSEQPCVSIKLSSRIESFADKEGILLRLKNSVNRARNVLKENYNKEEARKLTKALKHILEDEIDLNHSESGFGIYLTPNYQKVVSFPFPVEDRVCISNSFEVSDILEAFEKMINYYVLCISKNHTRLFRGVGTTFEEIIDKKFPMHLEKEFQVHRASPHSLYNDEESKIDQERLASFLRKIDIRLGNYLRNRPLIIMGAIEHLGDFKSVSRHAAQIISEIRGNHDRSKPHEIRQKVWPVIEVFVNEKRLEVEHV